MSKNIKSKFKKVWKSEISPRLKKKNKLYSEKNKLDSEINKLYSEINKLDSERDKLYSEINKLYSEINKLDSEINKLYSEINKLDSERDKLYSEINKLYSEILMVFYNFGKENECIVNWEDYNFKLKEIKLKYYNKDKTGFIFLDMKGNETEELFEKEVEKTKVIDEYTYKLVEDN